MTTYQHPRSWFVSLTFSSRNLPQLKESWLQPQRGYFGEVQRYSVLFTTSGNTLEMRSSLLTWLVLVTVLKRSCSAIHLINPIKHAKQNGMPRRVSLSVSKESELKLIGEYFRTSSCLATTKSILADPGIVEETFSWLPHVRGLSSSFEALTGTYCFLYYEFLIPVG